MARARSARVVTRFAGRARRRVVVFLAEAVAVRRGLRRVVVFLVAMP
jgi:hypothetical protein